MPSICFFLKSFQKFMLLNPTKIKSRSLTWWEDLLLDAYENLTETPNLELKVLTLNINEGHNEELMEQCLILKEYAQYVAKVRNYTKEMKLDVAVEHANLIRQS